MDALFRSLGFTDSEIRVYLALADTGGGAAGILAKRVGLPRTTVYSALESLTGKGLVSFDEQGGVTRFMPNPPAALLRLLKEERAQLEQRQSTAEELVKLLNPYFRNRNFDVPRLQFFDGQKNVLAMLEENTPIWRESIFESDSVWWGYQDPTFVEQYRDWLDYVWTTMVPDEQVLLLSHEAPIEKSLRGKVRGREIRELPERSEFSSTIWILGHYIVMISTREKPHYSFQIRDAVFAANLRSIFKALWERAGSNTVKPRPRASKPKPHSLRSRETKTSRRR